MTTPLSAAQTAPVRHAADMQRLVAVVKELSMARDLDGVMQVVRIAARDLTGADGATFVLRDGDKCFYAEENAISPLWKGQRFPLKSCISGWAMLNKQPAVIEDIFSDPRIPVEAYRPTFVKSLAMVPIRQQQPIGAIGNYWASRHLPTEEEVSILQALADVTSVAIENIGLYAELRQKVKALEESNEELARFAWISSHDLKSPLRAIHNLSQWIEEEAGEALPAQSRTHMNLLRSRVQRMEKLLDDILEYSKIEAKLGESQAPLLDGQTLMSQVRDSLNIPDGFTLDIGAQFSGMRLPSMPLSRVFANLIDNAIKHHDKDKGTVRVLAEDTESHYIFTVADDGPGIASQYHQKIFEMFQTLKPRDIKEGSGIGLAIVKKLLAATKVDITVMSDGRGTAFRFAWPKPLTLASVNA